MSQSKPHPTTGREPRLGGPGRPRGDEPLLGGEHGMQHWLDALYSGDNGQIWRGARALARMGGTTVPRLVEALGAADYRVRAVAAWALLQFAEDDAVRAAVPALVAALDDRAETVRVLAGRALRRICAAHADICQTAQAALDAYYRRR